MYKQKTIFSSLALGTMLLAGVSLASAQDVYVNLSVLDSLGDDGANASQPLFPIVSPQKKAKASSARHHKPAQKAKKNAAKPTKVKVKKVAVPADDITIPEKKNIVVEELKPVKVIPAETLDLSSEQAQIQNQPVNKEAADKLLQTSETQNSQTEQAPVVNDNVIAKDGQSTIITPSAKITPQQPQISAVPAEVLAPAEIVSENVVVSAPVETPAETQAPVVAPLVPVAPARVETQPQASAQPADNRVFFAEDDSELSEANKQQIDNIIKSFEDIKTNKIAIYAYNYDNGEDVFRKKRQSLNRAVGIRSYLLAQGHKNFSIKVINVDEADKNNMVIVEELK